MPAGTRRQAIILLVVFLLSIYGGFFSTNVEAQQFITLNAVLNHIKMGLMKLTVAEAELIVKNSEYVEEDLLALSGFILLANDQFESAREAFLQLAQELAAPGDRGAYYTLVGRTYYDQVDLESAKGYYLKGLTYSEDQLMALVDLGLILIQENDLNLARQYLTKAEQIDLTGYPRLKLALGDLAKASQENQLALEYYYKAIQLDPNNVEAYQRSRAIYVELEDWDKEADLLEQAQSNGLSLN